MIDVSGLSKGKVLAALYNAAKPLGMGWLHADGRTMTEKDAESLIGGQTSVYFDYVKGRPLKVEINGHTVDPRLFDRDHGPGAAQRAIDALRKGSVLFEVRQIVADIMLVSVDDVLPESDLIEDLCADSLTLVELLLEAEDFGLEIPDDDVWNVRTVQQAADYIARRLT